MSKEELLQAVDYVAKGACKAHLGCSSHAPCANALLAARSRPGRVGSALPHPALDPAPPQGPPIAGITNELKLKFYALYKQATKGECAEKEPSRLQVVQRMKWNAYKALGKMSKQDAIKQYIAQLDKVAPDWRKWKSNPRSKL